MKESEESRLSKPYVFMTMKVPEEAIRLIREVAELHIWEEDTPLPKEKLIEEAKKADVLYTMVSDRLDEEVIRAGASGKLKLIANMGVGYDHIHVPLAHELGIQVTNTPDVLTETTADLTFALLMATARRVVEAASYLQAGKWKKWSPLLLAGQDIYGATIGIVGMGRIGEAVARRAKGFNMNILYYNRRRKPQVEAELGATYLPFQQLLQEADFVVCLTPLTAETRDLFGKKEFALMKPSAIFINASRGAVVDEDALYEALANKEIWAAGLDVFREEPVPLNHPLLQLDNLVALPHIGSASIETRTNMALLAAQNVVNFLVGKDLLTPVQKSR